MDNLKKNNKKYEYIFALIIIAVTVFLVCEANEVSKYVFCKLKEEMIPVCGVTNDNKGEILLELIPIAKISDIDCMDYDVDLSYDDFMVFADYNSINSGSGAAADSGNATNSGIAANSGIATNNGIATNTDATMFTDSTSLVDLTTNENIATTDNTTENNVTFAVSPIEITPISYSLDNLRDFDFLVSNCYAVDSSTSVNPDELNADNLLGMDMTIDTTGEDYKVLVYHTHGSEAFIDSRPGVIEDTVIGVGDELTRLLNEKGIKTYHDRGIYDTVDGVLDRSYAYTLSGNAVDSILEQYPSIQVVLDIHRDGVREDLKLVRVIDGKPTAQIMFLNGVSRLNINGDIDYLYNPNKIANLAFSLQMHLKGKELYGDLMRRIYIRGYSFNLEKMERASLVEVGAQTNTVEEAKNAMQPLANIIYNVLY